MLSADELANVYRRYLDPQTNWWPVRFMLQLHEAVRIVYSHVLAEGGDGVDLGANIGLHTAGMLRAPAGRVFAIEANPLMIERILRRPDVSGHRVAVLNLAIVPFAQETVSFRISQKYIELGSVDPNYFSKHFPQSVHDAELEDITVRAQTLDGFLTLYGIRKGFIKIDLEGIDSEVLKSAIIPFANRMAISYETEIDKQVELWRHFRNFEYSVFDCFMNELTEETFALPRVAPIDRFAFPREYEVDAIRVKLDEFWQRY